MVFLQGLILGVIAAVVGYYSYLFLRRVGKFTFNVITYQFVKRDIRKRRRRNE